MPSRSIPSSSDTRQFDSCREKGGLGGAAPWVHMGYTGHTPKAREVIGTSYRGPSEGPAHRGPAMAAGRYSRPHASNQWAIAP